ncbi:ribonuclease P protein component [Embleya scabrispora]|uniref:Ribonuclease P protein component n=1 Tax=Embleya scabrispora TaxID=159449 RepID=A0A1T3NZG5_9ACTN|nr:ribonuclease P protein component [Embleya scabrispora]OPC82040.1 ribonuclease P protein component [Embleya scabrispora]
MLPADNRLRRREDFAIAVRRGRRAGRPSLVVHLHRQETSGFGAPARTPVTARPSEPDTLRQSVAEDPHAEVEQAPPPRAGFVVSKAVGPAVVRNVVKRRLRHLIRDRMALLPAGSLVVVRALPPAAQADHSDLARDLDAAFDRLLGRSGRPVAVRADGPAAKPGATA